jgi:hypothetical protein
MGKDFHDTFEGITKTMGSLYTIPSTLFWTRWQPKLRK